MNLRIITGSDLLFALCLRLMFEAVVRLNKICNYLRGQYGSGPAPESSANNHTAFVMLKKGGTLIQLF